MGGFAQAITQGVGRLGSEYGQSREYLRQSRQQDVFARLQALQSALGLYDLQQKLRQGKLPQYRGVFTDERGNVHAIVTDATTGEPSQKLLFESGAKYPDFRTLQEMEAYAVTHGDTGLLESAQNAIKATQRTPVGTRPTEFDEWREAFKQSHNRYPNDREIMLYHRAPRADTLLHTIPDEMLRALANRWHTEGIKPPAKYQAEVEQYMDEHNIGVKTKLNPAEQRLLDLTNQIAPKVAQLKKAIEDAGLQNENSFIFSNHSSLMQHLRFYGQYKRGVNPERVTGELIRLAAALQVMGAGPWMQIGRGKYMFETITQHLPTPTDTPALLYNKAQFLEGIVDEARASLPQSEGDLNDLKDLFNTDKLVPK